MFVHIDGVCQLQPIYHWRAVRPNCKWFTNNWINNCTHIDWSKQSAGFDVRYLQIKVFWAVVVVVHFPGCCMDPQKKFSKGQVKCPHLAEFSVWIWFGKNDLDDGEAFSISICSSPDLCQSRMQCGKFQLQYEDAERFLERFPFQKVILPIVFFSMWRHKEIFKDI